MSVPFGTFCMATKSRQREDLSRNARSVFAAFYRIAAQYEAAPGQLARVIPPWSHLAYNHFQT